MKENKQSEGEGILPDEQAVLGYLRQHPDFFIRHAEHVEQMTIPHPVQGAVSLVEWQLSRQRQQIARLQEEITLLMEAAVANEMLFTQLLDLHAMLSSADSVQTLLERLRAWAHSLGLCDVTLWLFSEQWQLESCSLLPQMALSRQQFEPVRIQRMGVQRHYLGRLNQSEQALLLPAVKHKGSVALSLLGEQEALGVLIFSSANALHYQSQQGTLLLQHISQWLPSLLARWIARV